MDQARPSPRGRGRGAAAGPRCVSSGDRAGPRRPCAHLPLALQRPHTTGAAGLTARHRSRKRRLDLLDLLLEWGADPHEVDPSCLFGTYDSSLFERFRTLGVDLTAHHELAEALAYHTSNKPLFGFTRRHRRDIPAFQVELNLALRYHTGEASARGIALCLWAGADPHAPALDLRYTISSDENEEDPYLGHSAIHEACARGRANLLDRLGPDPGQDDFDELYRWAGSESVIRTLARTQPPEDVTSVLKAILGGPFWRFSDEWRLVHKLEALFQIGARWSEASREDIGQVRRLILQTSDRTFVEVMKLLAIGDHCDPVIRTELARTSAIRARIGKVGFMPLDGEPNRHDRPRPTRSREVVKKFGLTPPKPRRPSRRLPKSVEIGRRERDRSPLHLSRSGLYELIWSTPVSRLALDWGMSGRGLAKACRRIKVPVPARGYWAKKEAGHRVRRPRLPALPPGEAEEVVVWVPKSP